MVVGDALGRCLRCTPARCESSVIEGVDRAHVCVVLCEPFTADFFFSPGGGKVEDDEEETAVVPCMYVSDESDESMREAVVIVREAL